MSRRRFRGVYPVLYAFWNQDGRLDRGAMRAQLEHCIAAGAHGITVLGLVTEVHRMDEAERREVVEVVAEALGGRLPYAVTIAERDPDAQIAFARAAKAIGADWVILQPPPGKGLPEATLAAHFGRIADALDMPIAVQNNPVNLDSALSPEGLVALLRRHPTIALLKAEGWSVDIARVLEALGAENVDAFGGHGGLEFPALMESGGAGLIPAPDCLALQAAMFDAFDSGEAARRETALRVHKEILPLIVMMTRSLTGILVYGKRVLAERIGLTRIHDRPGLPAPTEFGLRQMRRAMADAAAAEATLITAMRAPQGPRVA